MNTRTIPFALFVSLVAAAVPAHAGTATPSDIPAPVRVEVVGDAALDDIRGKYFGASMLVGLRIQLVSSWQTAGGALSAIGSVEITRDAAGNPVIRIGSLSSVDGNGGAGGLLPNASTDGGDQIAINGIGQVVQIAGDGNQFANFAGISFVPSGDGVSWSDGLVDGASSASADGLVAQVTFEDGGIQLGLSGPGGFVGQSLGNGSDGGQILQVGTIAGSGQIGSNTMQMQMMTAAMPVTLQHQLGIQQALAGMQQLPR